ncbi:MAG: hypothetical protein ACOCYO_05730 [Bacteroidota bacterium]
MHERVKLMVKRYSDLYNNGVIVQNPVFYKHFGIKAGTFWTWAKPGGVQTPRDEDAIRLSSELGMNYNYIKYGEGEPFQHESHEPFFSERTRHAGESFNRSIPGALNFSLFQKSPGRAGRRQMTLIEMAEEMLKSGSSQGDLLKKFIKEMYEQYLEAYKR